MAAVQFQETGISRKAWQDAFSPGQKMAKSARLGTRGFEQLALAAETPGQFLALVGLFVEYAATRGIEASLVDLLEEMLGAFGFDGQ